MERRWYILLVILLTLVEELGSLQVWCEVVILEYALLSGRIQYFGEVGIAHLLFDGFEFFDNMNGTMFLGLDDDIGSSAGTCIDQFAIGIVLFEIQSFILRCFESEAHGTVTFLGELHHGLDVLTNPIFIWEREVELQTLNESEGAETFVGIPEDLGAILHLDRHFESEMLFHPSREVTFEDFSGGTEIFEHRSVPTYGDELLLVTVIDNDVNPRVVGNTFGLEVKRLFCPSSLLHLKDDDIVVVPQELDIVVSSAELEGGREILGAEELAKQLLLVLEVGIDFFP